MNKFLNLAVYLLFFLLLVMRALQASSILSDAEAERGIASFRSLDDTNKRGNLPFAAYKDYLAKNGGLTPACVQIWLTTSTLLTNEEKEGSDDKGLLQVKEVKEGITGAYIRQLFFVTITPSSRRLALKIWSQDARYVEERARNTYHVVKSPFPKCFNGNSDYPQLAVDEWAGLYEDTEGYKHYLHLMQFAPGISLHRYLKEMNEDIEKYIAILKRIGEVYGNAHAASLLTMHEDPAELKTAFDHPDSTPANIIIDATDVHKKPLVTLVDLEEMGMALQQKGGSAPLKSGAISCFVNNSLFVDTIEYRTKGSEGFLLKQWCHSDGHTLRLLVSSLLQFVKHF